VTTVLGQVIGRRISVDNDDTHPPVLGGFHRDRRMTVFFVMGDDGKRSPRPDFDTRRVLIIVLVLILVGIVEQASPALTGSPTIAERVEVRVYQPI